jgi:hypothetical protein
VQTPRIQNGIGDRRPDIGLQNAPRTGPTINQARPNVGQANVNRPTVNRAAVNNGLGSLNRTNVAAARNQTVNVNRQGMAARGVAVRNNFGHYGAFRGNGWWAQHPGAWRAARWTTAAAVWGTASWAACSNYCGAPAEPVYYDYGSNVVYDGPNVYLNGDVVATQEQYAQQAAVIADTGVQAPATKEEEWLSLGVFAMVQGEQVNGNDLFQLAVNKDGTIRGNYHNALSGTTMPVSGSVDKKSQRAAWIVGDRKDTVYEAGFANLTKDETTMLVHFGKDNTQQWTLVRVEQPADGK